MLTQLSAFRVGAIAAAVAVAFTLLCVFLWSRFRRGEADDPLPGKPVHFTSLTMLAVVVLCCVVAAAMYFVHAILALHVSYLSIPVFGALGGLAGSLIRNDNHLMLVRFDPPDCRLRLGFVGDMILGLGGSTATVFLLGSTLNFDSAKPSTYPLMVSIALISGIFGQLVIERAGQEFIKRNVRDLKRQTRQLQSSSSATLVMASMYQYDHGDYEGAIKAADSALKANSRSIPALVGKARALKKLGRVAEALSITQDRLAQMTESDTKAQRAALLYNVACYKLLLSSISPDDALALVRQSFTLDPTLIGSAATDRDLQPLWQLPEFVRLTATPGPTAGGPVNSPPGV